MADSHSQGLQRIARMEKNTHSQGRGQDAVPQMRTKLKGDTNPTKSGGICRATQGYKHG